MGKSFLRLDQRRALKDGTYPVQVAVGNNTNIYINIGVSIKPEDWDKNTGQCIGARAKHLNSILNNSAARITARIIELREKGLFGKLTRKQLKAMLLDFDMDTPPAEDNKSLGAVFRQVIGLKHGRTAEAYEYTLRKLQQFCHVDNVSFDEINKIWLDRFAASMIGSAINSRSIHLRNLRNVCNYAVDEGVTLNYPFRRYRIPTQETAVHVLPLSSLRFIASADLEGSYAMHRDTFMLLFYLIGINIIDLSKLTAANIVGDRIEYRRSKTGKLYSIKIEPEARAILERWRGKSHLLACFDGYKDYKDYYRRLNEALKKIGPKVGKDTQPIEPHITSYWARYSWATYAAEIGIPKDTISESLGHQYGSRVTAIYIKFSRDKIDDANRRVIDYALGK